MAAAYRSIATNTDSDGTIVVTKPSGLAAGDLLIGFCSQRNSSGAWDTPSGWTLIVNQSGPGDLEISIFAKVASAGDAAASDFTFTYSPSSNKVEVVLYAVSGTFASTNNIYTQTLQATTEAVTDTVRSTSGIIPAAANSLMIMYFYTVCTDSDNNAYSSYALQTDDTTWTERADMQDNGGTNVVRIGTATATRSAVTDTGYFEASIGSGGLGSELFGALLAINDTANASPSLSPVTAAFSVPTVSPTADANVTAPSVISVATSVPSVTPTTGAPLWSNTDKPSSGSISNTDKP